MTLNRADENVVQISSLNQNQSERMIAIIALGILEGVKNGVVDFTEAENCLFGPYGRGVLVNLGLSKKLVDIVHSGSALEDMEDIFPQNPELGLLREIEKLQNDVLEILRKTKYDPYDYKDWLDYQV